MNLKFYTKGYITLKNGKVDICDPCIDRGEPYDVLFNTLIFPDRYKCYYATIRHPENRHKNSDPVKTLASAIIISSKEIERAERPNHPHPKHNPKKRKKKKNKTSLARQFGKDKLFELPWENYGIIDVESGLAGFFVDKPQCTEAFWAEFSDFMFESDRGTQAHVYRTNPYGFWTQTGQENGKYKVKAYRKNINGINQIIGLRIDYMEERSDI